MKIIKVTNDNFTSEVLNSDAPVLVDFNAEWCGPCRMLAPVLEELASKRNDLKIVSINIDEEEDLAEKYDVLSIPCLVLFKGGEEKNRSVGLKPLEEIEEMLGD